MGNVMAVRKTYKPNIKLPDKIEQTTIFFLWVRKNAPSGLEMVDLRAVDTSKELVELHREMVIRDEPDATGVWIEERVTNHLYGHRDVRLAFRLCNFTTMWKKDGD
jgi:hypothetical protein